MKRLLSLILCLCMLFAVAVSITSCKDDAVTPPPAGDEGSGGNGNTNPFANTQTEFTVLCADKKSAYFEGSVSMIATAVQKNTGVLVNISTDFTRDNTEGGYKNDNYEILIGDTNRYETVTTECPEDSFIIKVVDKKVVIKGDNDFCTNMGVFYFINNCIGNKTDGTLLKISAEYSYTEKPTNEPSTYIDMLEKKDKSFPLFSSNTSSNTDFQATGGTYVGKEIKLNPKKVYTFEAQKDNTGAATMNGIQGGCTDGKYFYFLLTSPGDGEDDQTRVVKMDPETMSIVKVGPIISVAHSNDMTYDSKNNRLVIAWCSVDARKMSCVDMETLNVVKNSSIDKNFFAIAYDPVTNQYAFSKSAYALNGQYGMLIYKLGNTWKFIKEFSGIASGHTAQGIFCDSKYIYYTASPSGTAKGSENINVVHVYTWEGAYVCTLTIPLTYEIEHIFWYGDSFWAGFNCGDGRMELYQLTFDF